MPKPEQGRIILVETCDPQGQNLKIRPAIIISRTEEIRSDGQIACVAITSSIPKKIPADCVLLPYSAGGKSRTGLKMRSAAMCSWLFATTEEKIEKYIGIVPSQLLQEILAGVERLKNS